MKRSIFLLILFLSISLIFFFINKSQDQYKYSQLILSETELQQIIAQRKESDQELINSIIFNQYPLFYDDMTSSWFFSVDPIDPVLNPTVDFSPVEEKVKIAFCSEIIIGESIPFIAYNDKIYKKYCKGKKVCDSVIYVNEKSYKINDEFKRYRK